MRYGLTDHQLNLILTCIRDFPEVEKVVLFGSRAMGNFKPGSDLDLQIIGPKVTPEIVTRLFGKLNHEISVPFQFDLLHAPSSQAILDHIQKHGVVFYERSRLPGEYARG
jgi:uncharacterized protein